MISALEAWSKANETLKSQRAQYADLAYRCINEAAEAGKFSTTLRVEFSDQLVNLFTSLGYKITVIPKSPFSDAYTVIRWANPEHNNV